MGHPGLRLGSHGISWDGLGGQGICGKKGIKNVENQVNGAEVEMSFLAKGALHTKGRALMCARYTSYGRGYGGMVKRFIRVKTRRLLLRRKENVFSFCFWDVACEGGYEENPLLNAPEFTNEVQRLRGVDGRFGRAIAYESEQERTI